MIFREKVEDISGRAKMTDEEKHVFADFSTRFAFYRKQKTNDEEQTLISCFNKILDSNLNKYFVEILSSIIDFTKEYCDEDEPRIM